MSIQVEHEIRIDSRTNKRRAAENQLGQSRIESIVFFTAGHAEQRIDGNLQGSHSGPDQEQGNNCDAICRKQSETQGPQRAHQKCRYHYRFLSKSFHQETCRNRHHPVSNKESEGQKSRGGQAHMETADDVRDNRTKNIGHKGDHKKREQHNNDHVAISWHQYRVHLGRYLPVLRRSVSTGISGPEAIVPNPSRADKVGIFSERGQCNFGLLEWDKTAAAANHRLDAVKKQRGTLHHASTQDNHVGHEQVDEIGQTKAHVVGLSFNRLARQSIVGLCELADTFGREMFAMRILSRRIGLKPCHHCRTCSERFPATSVPARTKRSRWIDDLVAKFGMRSIDATVKASVENNSAANPGSHSHIDQSRFVFSSTPTRLRQGGRIGVVFQSYPHLEHVRQVCSRVLSAPTRKKINIAKLPGAQVHRPRGPNPYSGEFNTGGARRLSQHAGDCSQAVGVALGIGRCFLPGQYLAAVIHHTDRNFCTAYVNRPDHVASPASFLKTHKPASQLKLLRTADQPLMLLEALSHVTAVLRK